MDIFRRCLGVVNNKKKKKELNQNEEESTQNLCDDVVYLIVLRLPLRHAIQCKTLNKNLYHYISHQTFNHKHALLSSTDEIIHVYSTINDHSTFTKYTPQRTISLPLNVLVLASCNGLLLLSIRNFTALYNPCCVFNPITGQALFVDLVRDADISGPPGLAVNLGNNYNHPFKLVMTKKTNDGLRFEVIVPSGNSTTLKSRVDFVCTWSMDQKSRPVYLNGVLYWLGLYLNEILVFDVENEKAKLINGPLRKVLARGRLFYSSGDHRLFNKPNVWFGLAQGWLSFIYASREETIILSYDNTNDKWQIRHRIASLKNDCKPLNFDGEKLLFQLVDEQIVYVYEISTKRWEMKGLVERRQGHSLLLCIPFLPTLAKVYDSDIQNNHLNKGLHYMTLFQLQQFFRHH